MKNFQLAAEIRIFVTGFTISGWRRRYNFFRSLRIEGSGRRMKKEIAALKDGDWSLNLEDAHYETHPEEVLAESVEAIRRTKAGRYVNLVTPGRLGDPREWLIPQLIALVKYADLAVREIRYIDECGCGGHVTRVFR